MKSSSALFNDQNNWRAPRPPPRLIMFPKSTNQNSEIAILFSVVEKPYNYVFGDGLHPYSSPSPWEGLQVKKLWPVLTYSNAYWEVYRGFQGDFLVGGGGVDKRGICWGKFVKRKFHRGICHGGRKFPWRERRIF